MILKLTKKTGHARYVDFSHVAFWDEQTLGGTLITLADADHYEVEVKETAAEIAALLETHANAPATPHQTAEYVQYTRTLGDYTTPTRDKFGQAYTALRPDDKAHYNG